jgi:hypothetical protein
MAAPTGANSNIVNGSPRRRAASSAAKRFGGVPINVVVPPSSVANEIGISSSPTE